MLFSFNFSGLTCRIVCLFHCNIILYSIKYNTYVYLTLYSIQHKYTYHYFLSVYKSN